MYCRLLHVDLQLQEGEALQSVTSPHFLADFAIIFRTYKQSSAAISLSLHPRQVILKMP